MTQVVRQAKLGVAKLAEVAKALCAPLFYIHAFDCQCESTALTLIIHHGGTSTSK